MDWQPINTAPKDGTLILAWAPNGLGPYIAKWDTYGKPEGYFPCVHDCCGYHEDPEPSHWMPLPSNPLGHT